MIQMLNTKFDVSAVICFWVMLITDTHVDIQTHIQTDQRVKMWFSDSGDLKYVNPSKSSFWKLDPKTILSLIIGKRK